MNPTIRNRLIQAALALSVAAGGAAYVIQDAPSAAVVLAMEIGAHYESGGRHIGTPYVDRFGKGRPWTVCNGITGKGVEPGKHYTPDDCKRLEMPHYKSAEDAARKMFAHWPKYNVWVQASILDMIFNLGQGAVEDSTMRKKANDGDLTGACAEMTKWVRGTVDGKKVVLSGLVDRRSTTRELCAEWGRDGHFSAKLLGQK